MTDHPLKQMRSLLPHHQFWQPKGDLGKYYDYNKPDSLKCHEWYYRPVDIAHCYSLRSYGLHIKQVETKRRGQVPHLHVHDEKDTEPEGIKSQSRDYRNKDGGADHDDAHRVQDTSQDEKDYLHGDQDDPLSSGNGHQDMFHQLMSPCAGVNGSETVRPDENPDDHGRKGSRPETGLFDQSPVQFAIDSRRNDRP